MLSRDVSGSSLLQKRFITSDYESSDSPSSSDLSDNVGAAEDGVVSSPPRKDLLRLAPNAVAKVKEKVRQLNDDDEGDDEREGDPQLTTRNTFSEGDDGNVEDDEDDDVAEKRPRRRKGSGQSAAGSTLLPQSSKSADAVDVGSGVQEGAQQQQQLQQVTVEVKSEDGEEIKLLFDPEEAVENVPMLQISRLNEWDFPIFELAEQEPNLVLTKVAYRLFTEVGLMETFRIPLPQFLNYFHALEMGYRSKPYHNRIHATDVLHGVYYLTTQPIPGFTHVNTGDGLSRHGSSSESDTETPDRSLMSHRTSFMAQDSYGIMGGNLPALELMALYTAAAMHDYDHPGRTNAFLVATTAPQAVLYNDRSVLENYHAASAWSLLLNNPNNYFISGLEAAEFKRFRFLVIEAILATDLKRHFEILAEFNAKVNDEDAAGVDWTLETDRLLVTQMVIKLADINGPAKAKNLHQSWTYRIAEEFYEQGDEEASLGLPISPYMDRRNPQLAKLQETFINHLVAPLCNAMVTGGLLPGTWVDEDGQEGHEELDTSAGKDTEDDEDVDTDDIDNDLDLTPVKERKPLRKVHCLLTKNMKENYEYWAAFIKKEEEEQKRAASIQLESEITSTTSLKDQVLEKGEMEPIKEESESPPPSTPNPAGNLPHSPNSAFQAAPLSAPTTATATATTTAISAESISIASASLEAGPVLYSQQQASQAAVEVQDEFGDDNQNDDDDDRSTEV